MIWCIASGVELGLFVLSGGGVFEDEFAIKQRYYERNKEFVDTTWSVVRLN